MAGSPGKLQKEAWGRNYGTKKWLVVGMPAPNSSFPDVCSSLAMETPFKNTTQSRHSPFQNSSGFSIPAPLSFSLSSKLTLCSCTQCPNLYFPVFCLSPVLAQPSRPNSNVTTSTKFLRLSQEKLESFPPLCPTAGMYWMHTSEHKHYIIPCLSLFPSQVCELMKGRNQLFFILVTVTAHYLSGYQLNLGLLSEWMNWLIDKITNLIAQTVDFIIYETLESLFQEKVMSVMLETQAQVQCWGTSQTLASQSTVWAKSIDDTWKLVRNADTQAIVQTSLIRTCIFTRCPGHSCAH